MTDDISIPNPFLAKLRRGEIASSCLVKLIRTVEAPGILSVPPSIILSFTLRSTKHARN